MSGENKQEMEINLKPESMGKLSLRIIHERGEVLAKITAENEQVKGILESNMQLLKDSLEKSGFSVQSLSVSVGNGQERNRFGQNTEENGRAYAKGLTNKQNASSVSGTLDVNSRIIRDYYGQNSQIDLTA
jgi:flagellar hook-length control protein FliK